MQIYPALSRISRVTSIICTFTALALPEAKADSVVDCAKKWLDNKGVDAPKIDIPERKALSFFPLVDSDPNAKILRDRWDSYLRKISADMREQMKHSQVNYKRIECSIRLPQEEAYKIDRLEINRVTIVAQHLSIDYFSILNVPATTKAMHAATQPALLADDYEFKFSIDIGTVFSQVAPDPAIAGILKLGLALAIRLDKENAPDIFRGACEARANFDLFIRESKDKDSANVKVIRRLASVADEVIRKSQGEANTIAGCGQQPAL